MLQRYEILLLTVPEVTQDEVSSLESHLDQLVQKAKGMTLSFERWGKYRLSYPVRKNDYGVYFLLRFEIEKLNNLLEDVRSSLRVKFNDVVMRNMTSRLELSDSLAYQRPESLEEAPTRDVNSFLRKHKMEGLLSSVSNKEVKAEKAAEEPDKSAEPEEAPKADTPDVPEEKLSAAESESQEG